MAASKYNATWEQGTTINKVFTWREPSTEVNGEEVLGALINLTGWTARMQLRSTLESDVILHTFTTENGGIVLGGALGTITVKASATATAAWDWPMITGQPPKPVAVYDLELMDPSGNVTRFVEGKITLSLEVTR